MSPSTTHPTLVAAKAVVAEMAALGIAASNRAYSMKVHGEPEMERRFAGLDADQMQVNMEQGLNTFGLNDAPSIKAVTRLVAEHRAGNCQEQAALAFDKLARMGIRPVEIMSIMNQDHVLVVVGRVAGSPLLHGGWNPDTVICDPWAKRAYFVYALDDEMATLRSVTNCETKMVQKFVLGRHDGWA